MLYEEEDRMKMESRLRPSIEGDYRHEGRRGLTTMADHKEIDADVLTQEREKTYNGKTSIPSKKPKEFSNF